MEVDIWNGVNDVDRSKLAVPLAAPVEGPLLVIGGVRQIFLSIERRLFSAF